MYQMFTVHTTITIKLLSKKKENKKNFELKLMTNHTCTQNLKFPTKNILEASNHCNDHHTTHYVLQINEAIRLWVFTLQTSSLLTKTKFPAKKHKNVWDSQEI